MSESIRNVIAGLFVLAGLGAVGYLSLHVAGRSYGGPGGLTVYAKFEEIAQLQVRAPVTISGVKVGEVTGITLTEDFQAKLEMNLRKDLKLSTDTIASIVTAGVLGERYVILQPGVEDKLLKAGDTIAMTESGLILERVIGKLIHGSTGKDP